MIAALLNHLLIHFSLHNHYTANVEPSIIMAEARKEVFKPGRDDTQTSTQADGGWGPKDFIKSKSTSSKEPFKKNKFELKLLQSSLFDVLNGAAFSSFVGGEKNPMGDRIIGHVVSASASISCMTTDAHSVGQLFAYSLPSCLSLYSLPFTYTYTSSNHTLQGRGRGCGGGWW